MRNGWDLFTIMSKMDKESFVEHSCILLLGILENLPGSAVKFRTTVTLLLDNLNNKTLFPEDNPEAEKPYQRWHQRLDEKWNRIVQAKQKLDTKPKPRGPPEMEPLEDFRLLPILPREEDILSMEKPRLRRNKAEGAYDDLDHYLDIQFRLLWEDLVRPIRDSVKEIIEQQHPHQKQQGQNREKIRGYYQLATIGEAEFDTRSTEMLYNVQFDVSHLKQVKWEYSKRLQHAKQRSLLCFSHNGFKSMFFATIFGGEPANLRNGNLSVIIEKPPEDGLIQGRVYSFVESPGFFVPYKHVLTALQKITGPQDMPFVQHLVHCDPEVTWPVYIQNNPSMDFSCLQSEPSDDRLFVDNVLVDADWLPKESIALDESQIEAVRQALTRSLAVIQGPPGTGKTYVGLKIVQLLLEKVDGPILVVCYTNHALDQFLKGIASLMPNHQGHYVRIGGKMEKEVEKFNVRNFQYGRNASAELYFALSNSKKKRRVAEMKIANAACMIQRKVPYLLLRDQLDMVSNGGANRGLFWVPNRNHYKQRLENDEDIVKSWLTKFQPDVWPHWSQENLIKQLMQSTKANSYICNRAVVNRCHWGQATQYINDARQLMKMGYSQVDACFALGFNDGNFHLARNWLREKAASRRQSPPEKPPERLTKDDFMLLLRESLNPERDYDEEEFGSEMGDDEDAEQEIAGNEDAMFSSVCYNVNLPEFVYNCIDDSVPMTALEAQQVVEHAWNLPLRRRWRLYKYWQEQWIALIKEQQPRWEADYKKYNEEVHQYEDQRMIDNFRKYTKVIAMTTTCAAKKQIMLQQLRPKLVVIEEAAEGLEAHIITSLSPGCQHLILIGDHKQLRPNNEVYELAKHYQLDVSLFERLINNGFTHAMLKEQHRMRPEIANALMPKFYHGLQNHASVEGRDPIKGMVKNMFFIDHRELEDEDFDSTSRKNEFEAKYMVALCKYLLQQGYQPSQITILPCYAMQMHEIKRVMTEELLENQYVRVQLVDNFQGEENDIILLSLVRSNKEGKVGFLKTENRVCVALSRAKLGLYVVGNFEMLAQSSDLWKSLVEEHLDPNQAIGLELEIVCQKHPGTKKAIRNLRISKNTPKLVDVN